MVSREQETIQKVLAKAQRYREKYTLKKSEIAAVKRQYEEILDSKENEISEIRDQVEQTMKECIAKGEKAAFVTRDLIIKVNQLMKVMREEKKLANPRLVTQAIKEVTNLSDKIYEYIKVFDVNGKLATIDLQSIEATQQAQQQTIDLQNESSICNFYNAANRRTNDNALMSNN